DLQVSKQAKGEGQDEEPTTAFCLTIPQSVLLRADRDRAARARPTRQLLRAVLGLAGLPRPSSDRSLSTLRTWLDSWAGSGRIAVGMAHSADGVEVRPGRGSRLQTRR